MRFAGVRSRFLAAVAIVAYSLGTMTAHAQDAPRDEAQRVFQEALQKYRAKNFSGFASLMETALKLRPGHQPYLYNLAAADALAGKTEQALARLNEAAALGLTYPKLSEDEDFTSLRHTAEFRTVLEKFAENAGSFGRCEPAFVVHEKGLVPEGLAFDGGTETFFIGSIYRRKIVAVNAVGEARDFSRQSDKLWSVTGMKVDAQRRILWACTTGHAQMADAKKEDDGKSAICRYDLKTGALVQKFPVPEDGRKHWLGDLTLDQAGNVYASDSLAPMLFEIRRDANTMEVLCQDERFVNLQGVAILGQPHGLIVSDYLKGLFAIDLETKSVTALPAPSTVTLLGIDGIYAIGGDIIGVQNGITPNRIVRISFSADFARVGKLTVLASNDPHFDEPTLGTIVGKNFYFIANSQWSALDPKGTLAPSTQLHDPIILRLHL